jgi:ABC-type glycerol-3-phosphate transport system substrate-binding protein
VTTLAEMEKRQERRSRFRNYLGLAILLGALGWATVHVAVHSFGPESDTALVAGKKVIRFCHWQLEGRCVEALNEACREYERLQRARGNDVAVQQIEVPERAYNQWVRTQLIGRTAPDLIELRWGGSLIVRYFVPLTEIVERPNPYNSDPNFCDDPNLAGRPWREAYIDDMRGGWIDELRDYYSMPLSVFTIRIYANKDLLEEAAGSAEPPRDLGAFFEMCEKIRIYARQKRKEDSSFRLVPIAGSDYTANVFTGRYWGMTTWGLLDQFDENCDGWVGNEERIEAILTGRLDLTTDPYIRAGHQVVYDISRYFNPGFMAARRDESVFLFSQGNAALIATGSWDAGSLWRQVAGDFEITIFDFPIPKPGQKYGQFIRYRPSEAGIRAGFPMGLVRFSKHKDLAIDFMHFLTSQKINEKLNRKFRWFPAVRGAKPDPILEGFRPKVEGTYNVLDLHLGSGDVLLRYDQKYKEYISAVDPQEGDYEEFLAASRGSRKGFVKRYGALGRKFLDDHGGDPKRCSFAQYVRDWRDNHHKQFIQAFLGDFREHVLDDLHRLWVSSYHAMLQTEGSLAEARAKAMRHGLGPVTQRNIVSLIFGQAGRIESRWLSKDTHDRMQAHRKQAAGKGKPE